MHDDVRISLVYNTESERDEDLGLWGTRKRKRGGEGGVTEKRESEEAKK